MRKPHLIYVMIGLSGFAGLTYEIVWTRQLTLLFGVSIYAVSAVIAVFMLGLAAGSYFFGRLADQRGNPLVFFGIIELSVGLYAVLFPFIVKAITPLYLALYDYDLSSLTIFFLRFLLTFVLLIVPTVLMGGTLPVLGKLFSRSFDQFGNAVAKLYGLDTLGGMLGAALSGFFLLRWLGVAGSTRIAFFCNVLVGIAALSLSRYSEPQPGGQESHPHPARDKKKKTQRERLTPGQRRRVLVVVVLSGFCALSYEVLWTKMLTLVLGNSSWAFSTVVVAFLASIALGSLLIAPWLDRKLDNLQFLALLQGVIAITAFLSLFAFRWMATLKLGSQEAELWQVVFRHFMRACIIMAPPTLLSGAVLPLAARLCTNHSAKAGSQFGLTLAFNTAGSVFGSLAAGYLMISAFGIQNSIILLAVLNGLAAVWILHMETPAGRKSGSVKRAAAMLVVLALISSLYFPKPPLTLPLPGYEFLYYKEHTAGIVSIYRDPATGTKVFNLNNVNEVTTHESSLITFNLMAYLPYLLHKNPRDALVITFGAGIVAGTLAQLDLSRLDCVEINPNAAQVGRFFAAENHDVINNPKLNLFIEDGRNFLATTSRKYDIITADATHPTGADSWVLFTKEYYELCRQHLGESGFFVQWLPLHALSKNYYQTILATAAEVFDDLSVWFTGLDLPVGHTLMIGAMNPLTVDFQQLRAKMQVPLIRNDMANVGIDSPESLLSHFITNKNNLLSTLKDRAINTDDRAITAFPDELPAPDRWAKNLALIAGVRANPVITNAPADAVDRIERLSRVSGWLVNAMLNAAAGNSRRAREWADQIKTQGVEMDDLSAAFTSSAEQFIGLSHLRTGGKTSN